MILIQRQVLSSSAASVTFSNIPQNYRTLKLVVSGRSDRTPANADNIGVRFNGDTGNNYTYLVIEGNSVAASSFSGTMSSALVGYTSTANNTSNTFGSAEIVIPNYTGSSNKVMGNDSVTENNASGSASAFQVFAANLWNNTSAITSIVVFPQNSNWVSGSSFSLYGLL